MRSNLAKVLLILLVLVATVAALTACAPNTEEENPATVLESIDIEGGNSISIEEGTPFNPADYTLIAVLSDGSRLRVPMSAGMFSEEELAYLNSAGKHALKVSYSLNGITIETIFDITVVAKVVEPTKYTVKYVMPIYDGNQYGKQHEDSFVDTLTKPFIEPNEGDPTFIEVEWYTRADFAPNTIVSFPLNLTENNTVDGVLTIYGKAIDSRRINIRYVQRTVNQDGSSVAANPFYSDPNKYSYGDNHRTLSADGIGKRNGYDEPYLEIKNYQTGEFERLECNADFKIENKYIEPSKLSDGEIDVYIEAVYNISRFTVVLEADKNADGTIDASERFYLDKEYRWSSDKVESSYFYYNETLTASLIPTATLTELQVTGKNLSWTGYQLAGHDTIYVTGNLVITGVYSDVTYEVVFYRHDDSMATSFSVPHGSTIGSQVTPAKQLPQVQSASGYTFKWEYYLEADNTRHEITNNAIADVTVYGELRVYETRTANVYKSTFKYITGSTVRLEEQKVFRYAVSVEFPTVSELKTEMPEYGFDYFKFEWFLEQPVESSKSVNVETETQHAADTVYYLRVSDMRRLTATVVLPAGFSRAGKDIERQFGPAYFDTGSSKPSSIEIIASDFALDIIESRQYSELYTDASLSDKFDGETVRFNNGFWASYGTYLDAPDGASEDGYFDYSIKLYMKCTVRTFEVTFYEQLSTSSATKICSVTVDFGESPDKPTDYDLSDRTVNGEIYSFYGWYSMPDDVNTYVSDTGFAALKTERNLEFYAKWQSVKEGTYGVIYEDYNGYYAAVDYQGAADEVRIATEINGRTVNGIAAELFFWSEVGSEVRTVYLHSGIEYIESGAFTPCNSLENVFVNGTGGKYSSDNGVLYMKNDDNTLTLVKYPILKTPVGSYALRDDIDTTAIADEALTGYRGTGINLGTALKEIGARAFKDAKLQTVTLPTSLEKVGEQAFFNAASLATVTVSGSGVLENAEEFGKEAFDGTAWFNAKVSSGTTQIKIGGVLLTVIDDSESITLDDDVSVIAASAFVGVKATLKSFTATANSQLGIIGARAFEGCSQLSSVSILSDGAVVRVDGSSLKNTASALRVTVASSAMAEAYRQSAYWRAALGANVSTVIVSA